MQEDKENQKVKIDEQGSLGLLALGDIGLRAWRKVKKAEQLKRKNEGKD